MKKIFAQAESCILFEEYELANPLYLLLEKDNNYNVQYKIGICYLNIPGEKEKAIPYLESAVKHSSYDARINSFKEKRAPLDSYFFLAKAYMINNRLEDALNTLTTFKKLAVNTSGKGGMKNIEYIDQEMQACRNAISFQENPVNMTRTLLGSGFSQGAINENPAVSFDGNTIVYTERRGINNAIMFSKKINGEWQPPVEINNQLGSGEDCSSCSLNYDGTLLFLYKTGNYDGNIYSSEYKDGSWTRIRKLNANINTKYYESHASVSADGKELYFTSNREGGSGSLDIYVSALEPSGDWGPAVNLGPEINTPYNEDTPFITRNDSVLYFSSEGHDGMGSYDIFKSTKNGTAWGKPVNIGFPVSTTDDDRFFQPASDGRSGYYSMVTGYKKKDIFLIDFPTPVLARQEPADTIKYEKLDLSHIPEVPVADSTIIKDLQVKDITDNDASDTTILFYTVQVMALYNPIDISYFRYVSDIKIFYNANDSFYRYTTGVFREKDDAYRYRDDLIAKGYPNDLFIKKVTQLNNDMPVGSHKYFSIQLKATAVPVDIKETFPGLSGIREAKEIDGMYHYLYGTYTSSGEAKIVLQSAVMKEYRDAFVREISVIIKN
ncbi:MAG: hypothetical protein WCE64_04260 [Bacteroidales bacterium]